MTDSMGKRAGYTAAREDSIPADPLLWRMEGIDVTAGLAYAGQDGELYREILSDYMDSIEEQAAAIEQAVEKRDIDTFTIEVHSLKSISRTIGAQVLSDKARELEDHGKRREWEPILAKTGELLAEYRNLYSVICPYHTCNQAQGVKKPIETDEVKRLLTKLCDRLEEYDSIGAEAVLTNLTEYDFAGSCAVYVDKMVSALDGFDYETCRRNACQLHEALH